MLAIRFLRVGKKNQPFFQIVVTEKSRGPKSKRFIEKLGFYNPLTKERRVLTERVKYWLSVGAKPSDTVWNLLVKEGVVKAKKIPVHTKVELKVQEKQTKTSTGTETAESTVKEVKIEEETRAERGLSAEEGKSKDESKKEEKENTQEENKAS